MSGIQRWPLSQTANKGQGACSVCFQHHQLHHKDNTVHLHGPRAARCPGSNKPPLSQSRNSGTTATVSSSEPVPSAAPNSQPTRRSSLTTSSRNKSASNSPSTIKKGVNATQSTLTSTSSSSATTAPAVSSNSTSAASGIDHPKTAGPILKHIPRSAHPAYCSALTTTW